MDCQPDIPYCEDPHELRRLDLYQPGENANGAAILFIHGGGWSGGSRTQWKSVAEHFAGLGYLCASAGYRLAPAHHWPAQFEDVRLAMGWLHRHAERLGVDVRRIAAAGSSAGGHLAAMLATTPPGDDLGATPELIVSDTRPAAAVCYCPVLTLHEGDRLAESVFRLIGAMETEAEAAYAAASPLDRLRGDEPPFLFLHGDADLTVPLEHTQRMHRRLTELAVDSELVVLPGVEHGFGYGVTSDAQRTSIAHVAKFLARVLLPPGQ
ncbi:MAG: Acetyl esterase [Phycisphaerae bacterium]|nr:Acetyl esterase [Phycisphaerae bacterium]